MKTRGGPISPKPPGELLPRGGSSLQPRVYKVTPLKANQDGTAPALKPDLEGETAKLRQLAKRERRYTIEDLEKIGDELISEKIISKEVVSALTEELRKNEQPLVNNLKGALATLNRTQYIKESKVFRSFYNSIDISKEDLKEVLNLVEELNNPDSKMKIKGNKITPLLREEIWQAKINLLEPKGNVQHEFSFLCPADK